MAAQNSYVKNADGSVTTYTYDKDGNCTIETLTNAKEIAATIYDPQGTYVERKALTIGKFSIPYMTAPSGGKVRFPDTSAEIPIMGLPPMSSNGANNASLTNTLSGLTAAGVSSLTASLMSGTSFDLGSFARGFVTNSVLGYNSYKQAVQSFPILTIEPLDVVYRSKISKKPADKAFYSNVIPVKYMFAVDPQNLTISYSHTNNFQESGIENKMRTFMQNSTVNEIKQFASTSGGMYGKGGAALTSTLTNAINGMAAGGREFLNNLAGSANTSDLSPEQREFFNSIGALGNSLLETYVGGGRIDFPNIWTDAQTTNSQTFTIHLRTLSANPENKQYWREILVPLYCLLTLSLPPGGTTSTYFNPAYIKCSLDSGFYQVDLGGISSISIDFPANEFNFLKVPRHVSVSMTITDMYNIMSQDIIDPTDYTVIENTNLNFTTKDKLIERLSKTADGKSVYNATLMQTEFEWSGAGSVLNTVSAMTNVVDSLTGTNLTGVVTSTIGTISSTINKATSSVTGAISGTSSSSSSSSSSTSPTSLASRKTKFLDDEPEEEIEPLFSLVGIRFEGNDPTAGNLEFTTSTGIKLCTFINVKNVLSTSTDSGVAVKNLLTTNTPIYGSDGFDTDISIYGETPEISPQFLTNLASKVGTKLRYLFGYTDD